MYEETIGELGLKKYVQFSSHDSQMANVWEFLGQKDWYYIPYASYLEIQLSIDEICLE
jgi:hypothetical protein